MNQGRTGLSGTTKICCIVVALILISLEEFRIHQADRRLAWVYSQLLELHSNDNRLMELFVTNSIDHDAILNQLQNLRLECDSVGIALLKLERTK